MNPTPPPTLESELLSNLYTDQEKDEIRVKIEEAASANRLTVEADTFRPRKQGLLFPVLVNVAAVVLVVGAWFGADAYFQDKQQGLKLKTDKLFSTESKLLAKVLEDAKNQLAAKNDEINKIQDQMKKMAVEKADLQKSFTDRVASREKALRQELADTLAIEKKRLEDAGFGTAEVTKRLAEFEAQKNAEFNNRLDTYRKQVQAEIDQRTLAVTALQTKLQATVTEQAKLRQEVENQTKEREKALSTQLSSQAADLNQLQKERDDLNLFFRQTDNAMGEVRAAFESADWTRTQAAVTSLRQVLARASASASESVRARAQAETALAASLDSAVEALSSTSKAETSAQVEAAKAQAKKEQALAALQLAETQRTLAASEERWRQAQAKADELGRQLDEVLNQSQESTNQTISVRNESEALKAKIAVLERTVDDLIPFRSRAETLEKLFTASYATARERFLTTLGSEAGLTTFPGFNSAWQDLDKQNRDATTAEAARQKALGDVLAFTTYFRGQSTTATAAKVEASRLARTDENFKKVVDSIQELVVSGPAEAAVNTAQTRLYGTVTTLAGTKVLLEPLTKERPQVGDTIEIHRLEGRTETVLGQGPVLTATDQKLEVDWSANPANKVPRIGDKAYLVLSPAP